MRGRKLSGKLLEAFSLLCQSEERFVSYMGESWEQMAGPTNSVEASEEAAPEDRGGPEARDRGRIPQREKVEVVDPVVTIRAATDYEDRRR
jgi:hypothetical protein